MQVKGTFFSVYWLWLLVIAGFIWIQSTQAIKAAKIRERLGPDAVIGGATYIAGGIECGDGILRFITSVSLVTPGTANTPATYSVNIGRTVDVPELAFEIEENLLDNDTAPLETDEVANNIRVFLRIRKFTQMNAATYSAIQSYAFWR